VRLGAGSHRHRDPDLPLGVAVGRRPALQAPPASLLVFGGIISVQIGAGLAARLFSQVGPAGMTGLRLWWGALIMAAIGGRGLVRVLRAVMAEHAWRDLAVALCFGVVLGIMNFSIYQSFARIPLGVAVTIEFLGPLAVAVASSRRRLDVLWVVLAAAGVLLLTQGGSRLARGQAGAGPASGPVLGLSTQAAGIGFALLAAAGWAAYIMLSRATGRRFSGSSGLVIAMIVAALVVTGPSIGLAGPALTRPGVVFEGLAIGLLSSVIPYRLELEALRRVPAGVFGIWMSVEPAVAALVGLVLLGEALIARQWVAVVLVVIASAGASRSAATLQPPEPDVPPPAA
jgi:inner membrane transporter RhtA